MITIINLLLAILFFTQIYFFEKIEPTFSNSIWGNLLLIIFFILLALSCYTTFVSARKKFITNEIFRNRYVDIFSILGIVLVFIMSIIVNVNKNFLDWDALALYDARARFLTYGINFSQMSSFATFDNLNKYYYSLYPPYTSIIHFFIHKYIPSFNISLFYSLNLLLFSVVSYLYSKKYIGKSFALLMAFMTISNKDIFVLSTMQYTNLPFALFLIIGIFSIFEYLNEDKKSSLYWGSFFVSASIWIRYLEPIWIAVIIAFAVATIVKKGAKGSILDIFIISVPSFVAYKSWAYFTGSISKVPSAVSFNLKTFLEPIVGIFTGSLVNVGWDFVTWFAAQLILSFVAIFALSYYGKKVKVELVFLELVIILTVLVYFAGLYFVSFQSTWWSVLGDSLERSSIFIIPIIIFLMLFRLKDYLNKKNVQHS